MTFPRHFRPVKVLVNIASQRFITDTFEVNSISSSQQNRKRKTDIRRSDGHGGHTKKVKTNCSP